ncbi:MAG: PEP-CTERM sorting domain-containing protein [Pirellulaceae bacterium]|nr:PEP-CTERM sorting domain-containing protein [Pirellulaceae bacterium]
MKPFFMASLVALAAAGSAQAAIITQWDFEGDTLTPNSGTGTAILTGGTTGTFATGNGGGRGWNTATYAAQSEDSGMRGVSFLTSTLGFENITVSLDHRASGTASRWARFEYTTDGGTSWTPHSNNAGSLSPHDTFYSFNIDLGALSAVENNPNFGFRVVSIFSPLAFDQNASLADFGPNTAYMRANAQASYTPGGGVGTGNYGGGGSGGTWRFDNVTISGTAVPEPSSIALLTLVTCSGTVIRFRRAF